MYYIMWMKVVKKKENDTLCIVMEKKEKDDNIDGKCDCLTKTDVKENNKDGIGYWRKKRRRKNR